MGLLTDRGPPSWHPATDDIKLVCKQASDYCKVCCYTVCADIKMRLKRSFVFVFMLLYVSIYKHFIVKLLFTVYVIV